MADEPVITHYEARWEVEVLVPDDEPEEESEEENGE